MTKEVPQPWHQTALGNGLVADGAVMGLVHKFHQFPAGGKGAFAALPGKLAVWTFTHLRLLWIEDSCPDRTMNLAVRQPDGAVPEKCFDLFGRFTIEQYEIK